MHNSFLASFLSYHNFQPENTYFYFFYSRNNPALSGSNSSPEEKQSCEGLVVCMFEVSIYCTAALTRKAGGEPDFCTLPTESCLER